MKILCGILGEDSDFFAHIHEVSPRKCLFNASYDQSSFFRFPKFEENWFFFVTLLSFFRFHIQCFIVLFSPSLAPLMFPWWGWQCL